MGQGFRRLAELRGWRLVESSGRAVPATRPTRGARWPEGGRRFPSSGRAPAGGSPRSDLDRLLVRPGTKDDATRFGERGVDDHGTVRVASPSAEAPRTATGPGSRLTRKEGGLDRPPTNEC